MPESDAVHHEWSMALEQADAALRRTLGDVDTPQDVIERVAAMKFAKYIYPMAAWIEDPAVRIRAGVAFTLHCWGIKLLDDIIDQDTGISSADLAVAGNAACFGSLEILSSIGMIDTFIDRYAARWPTIWRFIKGEPGRPLHDIEAWTRSSRIKCGHIMAFYAEAAAMGKLEEAAMRRLRSGISSLGILFTALDDFRDGDNPTEQHANLKALIRRGKIRRADALKALEAAIADVEQALATAPPFFPFLPGFIRYFDLCKRILADPEMAVPAYL